MIQVTVACCKCQSPVELMLEPPKVLNFQAVSMCVWEHPTPVLCSNKDCRAVLIPILGQIRDAVIGTALKPESAQHSSIVIPGQ